MSYFRFLSGVACKEAEALGVGLMAQPNSYGAKTVARYPFVAYDNGCFTNPIRPGDKAEARWLRWLDRMPPDPLFAIAPDVPFDAMATLSLFWHYFPMLQERELPIAYAAQNGAEHAGLVPWHHIDALFIGGDTVWKLSHHALYLCRQAQRRGVATHMGRANSRKRFIRAQEMMVDSADGNFLRWNKNHVRLRTMLDTLPAHPQLALA